MKINQRNSLLMLAVATALVFAGCGHKEDDDSHAHEAGEAHETESGVTFSAKKGLHVPLETAKIIGLEVADVEERTIAATFEFSAQVYRAASETQFASLQPSSAPTAMASGNVSANDAAKLSEGQTVSVQRRENGVQLSGRVVALKREFQKANGQVEVLLAISDEQKPLAIGEFVSVTVPVGREESVTAVPRS
ncbi:MAG: HlyD family efflux transporter periplasmic adaptor subunit, partial [Limisphaerales bacterium]